MTYLDNLRKAQQASADGTLKAPTREERTQTPEDSAIPKGFTAVKSSNIRAIRFRESQLQDTARIEDRVGHVQIQFYSGDIWQYGYIRRKDYYALLEAPSVGKHFCKNIKLRVDRGELQAKQIDP